METRQLSILTAYREEDMGDGSLIMINFNWITVVKAQVVTKHFTCRSYAVLTDLSHCWSGNEENCGPLSN